MEERKFKGIILPLPFSETVRGSAIGIISRELAGSPEDIKINIAKPNAQKLSKFELYWLENCPEASGNEWSEHACAYYVIQRFSRIPETGLSAIRVKPDENNRYGYDFIFWKDGKAVPIGQQYIFGSRLMRTVFGNGQYDLDDVVKAWEKEDCKIIVSTPIYKFESEMDKVLAKDGLLPPYLTKMRAQNKLEIQARNAGWPATRILIDDYI